MKRHPKLITFLFIFLSMLFPVAGDIGVLATEVLTEVSGTVVGADGNSLFGVEVRLIDLDAGKVIGTVVGADGNSLFGVEVRLIDLDTGKVIASEMTGSDGKFSFSSLRIGKTYKVVISYGKDTDCALVMPIYGYDIVLYFILG